MGLFGSTNLGVWHGSLRIVCAIFGLCTLRTIDNAAISSLARSYYVGFEFSPIGIVSVVARSCLSGVVVLLFWFDTLCFFLANTGFHKPWLHILTPFSLPNSLSFLGASVMMTDLLHLGSSMPMRTFACLNSAFLLFGLYRVDSSVSMLDFALIASSHSLRSFARPDLALSVLNFLQLELLPLSSLPTLVLDFLRPGSGTSLRLFAHFGFIASLFGLSWLGFVFSLSTTEFSHLGLPSSCRSFVCLDRTASALDLLYLGMVLPFRTFAQLSSQIFASGLSRLASVLSVLEHVNFDLMSLS